MAKQTKKNKVSKNFGDGVKVVVINSESDHFEKEGIIQGSINAAGEYQVLMTEENGTTIPRTIHANDLDDLDSAKEGSGFTVSVNGGKPVDFKKVKDRLSKAAKDREEKDNEDGKDYVIKEATLVDDLCNYTYQIIRGVGAGDTHAVKGSGIAMDELLDAFGKFNVHLAVIDDVFKHSSVEIEDIDTMHNDGLTMLYSVSGFKIKGGKDNESIILIGTKFVSGVHGRIAIVSPKIPLDNLSSYQWHNELKAAADNVRYEVERYKEGYCTQKEVEEEEIRPNPKQLTIGDAIEQSKDDAKANLSAEPENNEEIDSVFDSAKVQ